LVLTRSKNEYKETSATTEIMITENKRPPLAKLKNHFQRMEGEYSYENTYAFPRNRIPVPTNAFRS
jgi:hypothetical protein